MFGKYVILVLAIERACPRIADWQFVTYDTRGSATPCDSNCFDGATMA